MAQAGLLIPVDAGQRVHAVRAPCSPTSATRSRSPRVSARSRRTSRASSTSIARSNCPRSCCSTKSAAAPIPPKAARSARPSSITSAAAARSSSRRRTTKSLKSYAATTDGVATAGFGFHPDTYAPTYKLLYGAPGRSLALEIAGSTGHAGRRHRRRAVAAIGPRVAAGRAPRADGRRTGARSNASAARSTPIVAAWPRSARTLLERESAPGRTRGGAQEAARRPPQREAPRSRAEIDRVVGTLKAKAAVLAERAEQRAPRQVAALSTGEVGHLRADARAALGAIGGDLAATGTSDGPGGVQSSRPAVGARVFVKSLGAEGDRAPGVGQAD